ncbi:HD domain-containing protein [Olivibacter sp. SDN3]|uniref:Pycsar system effector family protein n=1 Tax=Olivibacter sp. SDN3 TaxID=2764720 RepID=UPI0016516A34|nr:Pycsar system effector family protein [Olivibacter sp. SDN3]QNL52367.1 HD domain-containing protein [Olivibacter sp. SDN3]
MNYTAIIAEAAKWVGDFMEKQNDSKLCFHDGVHTFQVVEAAKKISTYYQLDEKAYFIVIIAAYFHDLGYYTGPAEDHEVRSAQLATRFLQDHMVSQDVIAAVQQCIKATRMPQRPSNLLEQIVCDADLFHLGSNDFTKRNRLMRKEAESCKNERIDKETWQKNTIALMERHHYHTDYGKQILAPKKQENLRLIKEKNTLVKEKNNLDSSNKKKNNRPDRGIETMFRVTSTNNQRLSDMADNKANILITVNSIILSVIIALLLRKLDDNEHLTIPTFVLLAASLTTMVYAILATRPAIPNGVYAPKDVKENKVNLLFFGNFHRMPLENYNQGMKDVMEDRDLLYGTLIKDVYSQGVVLGRKYRLLRLAYNIFMYGLIVSVLSFIIVIIYFS